MSDFPTPLHNRLLASLPAADFARLAPHLEPVHLAFGNTLSEVGATTEWLYFPTSCIVSLMRITADGSAAETAISGNDGMSGIEHFMSGQGSAARAVVQHAGHAFRIRAVTILDAAVGGGPLQQMALRYAQALLAQMAQTMVCNRHHSLEQQLCRWLLLRLDLLGPGELHMTQEQIANTLGVRRESVTETAGRLQAAGIIRYRRGHICVLDHPALVQRSCECHILMRTEYRRLFSGQQDSNAV